MEYKRGNGAVTQLFPVLISYPEKYTFCSFCRITFRSLSFRFSHWYVHMGQMDIISSIFVSFVFKIIWEAFRWSHVTDAYADQSPLSVHSSLMDKQHRHIDSDQRIYPCAVWSCCFYQIVIWDLVLVIFMYVYRTFFECPHELYQRSRPKGYKTYFMLILNEHEISTAHKN